MSRRRKRRHDYEAYLKSPEWRKRRAVILKAANGLCRGCGRKANHVHHRTYKRLGCELTKDLVALCVDCHRDVHLYHVEHPAMHLANATDAFLQERRELFGLPPVPAVPPRKPPSPAARAAASQAIQQIRGIRCSRCSAQPGEPCRGSRGGPKPVNHSQREAAYREQQRKAGPRALTVQEINAAKSPAGSWTRAQLATWGVPWPPPKGWKKMLLTGQPLPAPLPRPPRREKKAQKSGRM